MDNFTFKFRQSVDADEANTLKTVDQLVDEGVPRHVAEQGARLADRLISQVGDMLQESVGPTSNKEQENITGIGNTIATIALAHILREMVGISYLYLAAIIRYYKHTEAK